MSAAIAREALEGAIWQAITWAIRNADETSSPVLQGHVRIVLARADAYVTAAIADVIDDRVRQRRLADAAATRKDRLADAEASAAEHYARNPAVSAS